MSVKDLERWTLDGTMRVKSIFDWWRRDIIDMVRTEFDMYL